MTKTFRPTDVTPDAEGLGRARLLFQRAARVQDLHAQTFAADPFGPAPARATTQDATALMTAHAFEAMSATLDHLQAAAAQARTRERDDPEIARIDALLYGPCVMPAVIDVVATEVPAGPQLPATAPGDPV